MALVVVGHGSAAPFFQWQARLRAIQGLNLAFFIHAEHDRLLSTIIRNRRFLNLCRDAAFKLRTPQDEGLASSLAARNGAEVVRGLGDNTPRLRRQRRQTRPDIGRVDP